MAIAPQRLGIGLRRFFTTEDRHPYDEVVWDRRDARISNFRDGSVAFEQLNVEVPANWSFNATNILAQKYFRGTLGTPERETSLKQVVDRIVDTIASWGVERDYFVDEEETETFRAELKHLLITQKGAFNSPVWFNIGVKGVPQQGSACFILAVEDSMRSILNWYAEEGIIFKGGSGAGVNLSKIRSSAEALEGGGTASGPVSFMRGADASAGTIKSGGKTRRAAKMVILDANHPDIEEFIWCKAHEEKKARALRDAGFDMDLDGRDINSIQYQNANNSVRVSDEFMEAVLTDSDWNLTARHGNATVRSMNARDLWRQIARAAWECADPGLQFDTTINKWHTSSNTDRINGSNPCSEYMHIDNSACNLASINLLKFLRNDGRFDVDAFKHAVEVLFSAQEILVGAADYPTEKIGENSRKFRQLGLGYANLGALLMASGLAYDSDEGRAWAAAITALMTGHAYVTSARTAGRMGPHEGYAENAEPMINVLRMHRDASYQIDDTKAPADILQAAQHAWEEAVDLGTRHGTRNAQATVLAPTGTIGLLMDCDTTGIEPDLGLVKFKKLVGGGNMSIVNQTVPRALEKLGYSQEENDVIIAYIDEHKTIVGAPALKAEHLPIFACSMGDNTIHYSGHVRMMGAVQPFISGAISKTVNMPEDATIEDVENLHLDAWRLGIKAVAIYRDNCKVGQPLSTAKKDGEGQTTPLPDSNIDAAEVVDLYAQIAKLESALASARSASPDVVVGAVRERLARRRLSSTFSFRVADCEGYVTVGEYEDGRPGEVFIKVAKQGSTLAGIMDAFSISVSLGLQHGVPLATFVRKYANMKFEPSGMTDDADLRIATSLVDYIFRRLALDYLSVTEREDLGVLSTGERIQPTLPEVVEQATPTINLPIQAGLLECTDRPLERTEAPSLLGRSEQRDAPMCYQCGNAMQRAGSCYVCSTCGATSGCS
ncbi:MAG TPA: vitamin B12-dependent ribonucleotide reductase [Acidimicrobiales bacterium]|nr:vitamin B12-dependent ribonucleotide reductase [Acidimicrobiales bacterium]